MPRIKYDWTELLSRLHSAIRSRKIRPNYQAGAQFLGVHRTTLMDALRREAGITRSEDIYSWAFGDANGEAGGDEQYQPETLQQFEKTKQGTVISDRLISIMEGEMQDETAILSAHGLDPGRWTIVAYRHNYWSALRPEDKGQIVNCQSRVTARPKRGDDLQISDIEEFFVSFVPSQAADVPQAEQYSRDGYVLEIGLADVHIDKRPYSKTDKGVDEKVKETITNIIQRAEGYSFSKIYFVPLGDILTYDNFNQATTRGTPQDSAGMSPKEAIDKAVELLIWSVDRLAKLAPVEVVYIPGNHDRLFGYCLAKILEAYYKGSNSVMVDTDHPERKWRIIGNSLVGWMHGDMPKTSSGSWLQTEARKAWGKTKYAEIHAGHFHSQVTQEKNGLVVRYLPSTTDPDTWHYSKGYLGNTRTTVSFLWDENKGLMEMWFSNV